MNSGSTLIGPFSKGKSLQNPRDLTCRAQPGVNPLKLLKIEVASASLLLQRPPSALAQDPFPADIVFLFQSLGSTKRYRTVCQRYIPADCFFYPVKFLKEPGRLHLRWSEVPLDYDRLKP